MTDATHSPGPTADEMEEGTPVIQQMLDHPFLLLFLGIAVPTALYIVWRAVEMVMILVGK